MWRKSTEVKPSSQVPAVPAPAAVKPPEAPPTSPQTAPATPGVAQPRVSGSSRIDSGLKIRGEFTGNSDLYIDGDAQGKIRLGEARVTVGPHGHVQADIEAREIIVEGSVQGNLRAGDRVRLGAASRVQGTILAPRIGIDDGAQYSGKVETTRPSASHGSSATEPVAESEALRPVSARAESE